MFGRLLEARIEYVSGAWPVLIPGAYDCLVTDDTPSANLISDTRGHRVPAQTGAMGMTLFLVSLGMLFGAGMLLYVIIRTTGSNKPDFGTLHIPAILLLSTLVLVVSSVTIQLALGAVRREKQGRLRVGLVATLLLSLVFLFVQTPGLVGLYRAYQPKQAEYQQEMQAAKEEVQGTSRTLINADTRAQYPQEMHVIALIIVHALHVIGGIIPLFFVTLNAHQGRYDHEHYGPVRFTAWYWHFLDVVWVVMLAIIFVTA